MSREPEAKAPRTGGSGSMPADGPGAYRKIAAMPPGPSSAAATGVPLTAVLPRMAVAGEHPAPQHPAGSTQSDSAPSDSTPADTDPASDADRPRRRAGLILAIVLVAQLMEVLDTSIVNIALPDMTVALHFTPSSLSWVVNAYALAFGGLLLLGARAGDILGRRRVFLAGIALFSLASLAGGFATTGGQLIAARVVQGIGAAFAAPSALAILMTLFPGTRERTRALGWFAAVTVGGAALGLIAGGILTEWASWRWVMFVNVPIGAALIVGIVAVLPRFGRTPGRFDLSGALTATVGVTAVVYGLVQAASSAWSDPVVVTALTLGAVVLAAFVWIELRATAPILPMGLFASRNRSTSHLVRLLVSAGLMGMFFFTSQFVQEVLGYSPIQAGMAFLPLTLVLFVLSLLTARVLTVHIDGRTLMIVGLVFAAAALLLTSRLQSDSTYLALLAPLVLFGAGAGLTFVPLTAMSLDGVAPGDAGAGSGLVNVSQQVGGAIGLAVLVTVFGHVTSPVAPSLTESARQAAQQAFVAGANRALLVAAALMAGAAVLAALLIRTPRAAAPAAESVGGSAAETIGEIPGPRADLVEA